MTSTRPAERHHVRRDADGPTVTEVTPGDGPALARAAALSDGVFAIAITLLVLEVREGEGDDLAERLLSAWPHYAAYALSFLVIGLMWLNHHRLLTRVTHLGTPALLANLLLLATVAFVPFPTGILAEHTFEGGPSATAATAFYAGSCLLVSASFFALTEAIRRDRDTHRGAGSGADLQRFQVRAWFAPVAYGLALGVAFVQPLLTLPLFIAVPLLFVAELQGRRGGRPVS
jgi:uncharacterized membrane protein